MEIWLRTKLKMWDLDYKLKRLKIDRQFERLLKAFSVEAFNQIQDATPVKTWKLKWRNKIRQKWKGWEIRNTQNREMEYNIIVHEWVWKRKPNPFFDIWLRRALDKYDKLVNEHISTSLVNL
jgi:hypothetical protein